MQHKRGFPGGTSGKPCTCQSRRCKRGGFGPCIRQVPWSRKCHPTSACLSGKNSVFLPPWGEEPGRLQSLRSQRVGHNSEAEYSHINDGFFTTVFWPLPDSLYYNNKILNLSTFLKIGFIFLYFMTQTFINFPIKHFKII